MIHMTNNSLFEFIEQRKEDVLNYIRRAVGADNSKQALGLYNHFVTSILKQTNFDDEPITLEVIYEQLKQLIMKRSKALKQHIAELPARNSYWQDADTSGELTLDDVLTIVNANQDATERLFMKLNYHGLLMYNLVELDIVSKRKHVDKGVARISIVNQYIDNKSRDGKLSDGVIFEMTGVRPEQIKNRLKWQITQEIVDISYAYLRYVK